MTDPQINPAVSAPEDIEPKSSEEAAEIVRRDPALNAGTQEDAATDDDARTPDASVYGETKDS